MKESKELKAARRDRVTRKVKMATLELTALTESGPVQWIEKVRANYPSKEWLREKFKRELMRDYKVLTGFRVIEESYGLYGMDEDAFFASAELIMELPIN